ncbi:MAG: hypothetical protein U0168_20495 [Nannocystaceae bacterium]
MPNVLRTVMTVLASLLLLVSSCKKTVEGESKRWEAGVTEVKGLMAQYPGFKPALEARLTRAQGIYDAATSLGEEQKIAKMAEANGELRKDFVGELTGLADTMKALREKRVSAAANAGDESSRLGAKVAAEDAGKALDRAESTLAAGAKDEAAAAAVVSKVKADLDAASSAIDKVLSADKDKKSEADKKADAEAKAKADAEAKVAPWKCEYCGAENPHTETACTACGAPRGDAKKDAKAGK